MLKAEMRILLILQRLYQAAADCGFSGTKRGNPCGYENDWHHEHHELRGKDVVEADSSQITFDHTQGVIQIDGAEAGTEDETDDTDRECFDPYGAPNLVPK